MTIKFCVARVLMITEPIKVYKSAAAVLAMQIIRYHFTPFFQTFYHPMTCKKKGDSFGDVENSN